jgi:flagellar biosynthesis chaperone FliJ
MPNGYGGPHASYEAEAIYNLQQKINALDKVIAKQDKKIAKLEKELTKQ